MVEFGNTLARSKRPEWAESYLDYDRLKHILKKHAKAASAAAAAEAAAAEERRRAQQQKQQQQQQQQQHRRSQSAYSILSLSSSSSWAIPAAIPAAPGAHQQDFRRLLSYHHHHEQEQQQQQQQQERQQQEEQQDVPPPAAAVLLRLEFQRVLDQEIEKVVLYSLELQGQISRELTRLAPQRQSCLEHVATTIRLWEQLQQQQQQHGAGVGSGVGSGKEEEEEEEQDNARRTMAMTMIRDTYQAYRIVARQVLDYVAFVELNATAVRKILKKHDKQQQQQQNLLLLLQQQQQQQQTKEDHSLLLLSETYLKAGYYTTNNHADQQQQQQQDNHLDSLYGLSNPGLSALVATLTRAFAELHQAEYLLLSTTTSTTTTTTWTTMVTTTTTNHTRQSEPKLLLPPLASYRRHHRQINSIPKSRSAPLMSEDVLGKSSAYASSPISMRSTPSTTSTVLAKAFSFISAFSVNNNDNDNDDNNNDTFEEQDNKDGGLAGGGTAFSTNDSIPTTTHVTKAREPLLDDIHTARSRLRQSTTNYVEMVAAQAALFLDDDDAPPSDSSRRRGRRRRRRLLLPSGDQHEDQQEEREEEEEEEECDDESRRRKRKRLSSFLNLTSTFLYMTNYYIVAPTTGQYALKVGSSEAMAALIVGMTPNAALIATVLYGIWSNYSYKSALLFAAASSILGNIAYALALHYHSIELVLIGRFLNGFGSARSINRRFIADTFSRAERTQASAAFVTAGGLGMAAGPAIAVVLGKIEDWTNTNTARTSDGKEEGGLEEVARGGSSSLLWTVETAPGWVMMGLWTIYFVAALRHFEEPDRSHLFGTSSTSTNEEQKSQTRITNNTTNVGETEPLLGSSDEATKLQKQHQQQQQQQQQQQEPPLYRNVPVMVTLWIYFVLKIVLESLLSSSATLTSYYFGWNSKHTGAFLAFLGLLMFPANLGVARLSQLQYQDRELIMGTLMVMLVSVLGILSYSSPTTSSSSSGSSNGEDIKNYSAIQYMFFGICLFVSANVLEGPNMSLLSKTIPKSWAKGTFNSGFLATEAGTLARSVGDVLISAEAALYGVPNLLNATFVPLIGFVGISIWVTRSFFDQMVEADDDDDEDDDDDDDDDELSSSDASAAINKTGRISSTKNTFEKAMSTTTTSTTEESLKSKE